MTLSMKNGQNTYQYSDFYDFLHYSWY